MRKSFNKSDRSSSGSRSNRPSRNTRGADNDRPSSDRRPKRESSERREDRPFKPRREESSSRPRRDEGPSRDRRDDRPRRTSSSDDRPRRTSSEDRPRRNSSSDDRPRRTSSEDRPRRSSSSDDRPRRSFSEDRPRRSSSSDDRPRRSTSSEDRPRRSSSSEDRRSPERGGRRERGDLNAEFVPKKAYISKTEREGLIRLNRFMSNAGIASRREADQLIELGLVTVNGQVVKELGTKVDPNKDVVKYDDRTLRPEKLRYVLLNKPKGYLTTMDDPEGRRTVMELIAGACPERIYPVGRLDRATTGLLLFTNDGDLAKRLMHPKHEYPKLYYVETEQKVRPEHLDEMRAGFTLDDGYIKADEVEYAESGDKKQVGIRIHSGRNRIVRRMFEHFGYTVVKLDRVMFAGLTKRDLPRGHYRELNEQEINFLRMIR